MDNILFPDIALDMVNGVLIDIDNTLYVYEPCHRGALAACVSLAGELGLGMNEASFRHAYKAARTEVTGRLEPQGACRSRFFAFQAMFEDKNISGSYVLARRFEDLYWSRFIDSMSPHPAAVAFLEKCAEQNIPVCAVSDMQAHFQVEKLAKLGMTDRIRFLVTSEEVGAEKPDKRMFEAGLKKLGLADKDVIMIGDNQAKDIDGANALGIKAYKVEVIT